MARLFDRVSMRASKLRADERRVRQKNIQSTAKDSKDTAKDSDGTNGQVDDATRRRA